MFPLKKSTFRRSPVRRLRCIRIKDQATSVASKAAIAQINWAKVELSKVALAKPDHLTLENTFLLENWAKKAQLNSMVVEAYNWKSYAAIKVHWPPRVDAQQLKSTRQDARLQIPGTEEFMAKAQPCQGEGHGAKILGNQRQFVGIAGHFYYKMST